MDDAWKIIVEDNFWKDYKRHPPNILDMKMPPYILLNTYLVF